MLNADDIYDVEDVVYEVARKTPLERSRNLSEDTGADVYLKLENKQRTGAFKIRGAMAKLSALAEQGVSRVVTASAGNHAQGVALAADAFDMDAKIVMPNRAPHAKAEATRSYGGQVTLQGADYEAAQEIAYDLAREENRTYVHAFDDWDVMAGQGTLGLEVMEQRQEVDAIVVPVGGGGLISGVATAVKHADPSTDVIGVQADGASSAAQSLNKGERVTSSAETVADGIAVGEVGEKPFQVMQERVDKIVTVSDKAIAQAVMFALERSKTVLEGAGAVSIAAVQQETFSYDSEDTVIPLCCGGNVDMNELRSLILTGMTETGRYLKFRTTLDDYPGSLDGLLTHITALNANIERIQHDRLSRDAAMNQADVVIEARTRGKDHAERLLARLESDGYDVTVLSPLL